MTPSRATWELTLFSHLIRGTKGAELTKLLTYPLGKGIS